MNESRDEEFDFARLERDLEVSNGNEYRAPSKLRRYGRNFLFWMIHGEGKMVGPRIEYYDAPESESEGDGLSPA